MNTQGTPGSRRTLSPQAAPTWAAHSNRAAQVECLLSEALHEVSLDPRVGLSAEPRLGVDVVHIEVLDRQLSSPIGRAFAHHVFTEAEIADAKGDAAKFALRWAVKEAVSKAIGTGFRQGLEPRSIEVLKTSGGSIRVAPASGCAWPEAAAEWTWTVSAAHEADVAVAVVLALPQC